MGTNDAGKSEPDPEQLRQEKAVETRAAVGRIKQAVADTKEDLEQEEAGVKPPHVPIGWAGKNTEADASPKNPRSETTPSGRSREVAGEPFSKEERRRRTNIYRAQEWFAVLQTTERSQTAVMKLGPGQASGEEPEAHAHSQQTLLLVSGQLSAEIAGKRSALEAGDSVIIPPGVPHKFTNSGDGLAVTFNVYVPPQYPPGEKG